MAVKILLLDSNLRLLAATSERLTFLGYEVHTASRVHDAVLKAIVVPPDLLVCDIMMPELNGWEIKRLAAQIPSLAATPVLFLGSHDALPSEFYAPEAGLVDIVRKPLTPDALAAAVAAMTARAAARGRLMAHPLSGALPTAEASLVDVYQVLARRAATGLLRLTAPGWSAALTWVGGALTDAVANGVRGHDAVYSGFARPVTDVAAALEPSPPVPPRSTVTKPLPDLLAEAVRRSRVVADAERSRPGPLPSEESDEDFLARLAATGLIRRTAAATR
ncbi:MAG: response regulator [Nitrospirota bacterium]